jgi:cytochrome c oxidase cbb3-type subunit 4
LITTRPLVAFAKSYGLFYLIGMSIIVLIYALWPANRKPSTRPNTAIRIRRGGRAMAARMTRPAYRPLTTGHEWNGIKELDTPVPKVVLAFLAITFPSR